MLDLPLLEATRRSICNQCEHYNVKKDVCNFIVLKTGKVGLLSHTDGVKNPKSRCPYFYDRKWNFIPSYWAFHLNYDLMPLTPQEVHEYTKAHYLSAFSIMDRIYDKDERGLLTTTPLRSQILKIVKELNATKNDYRHIKYLDVDYIHGELTPRPQS